MNSYGVTNFKDSEYHRLRDTRHLYHSKLIGALIPLTPEEHYYRHWRKYLAGETRTSQDFIRPLPKKALRELELSKISDGPRFNAKSAWGTFDRIMKDRSPLLDLVLRGKLD